MLLFWKYERDNLSNLIQASKYLDRQEINNKSYMLLWTEYLRLVLLHIENYNCLPKDVKLKTWISRQNYEYKNNLMNNMTKYIIWNDFLLKYSYLFKFSKLNKK